MVEWVLSTEESENLEQIAISIQNIEKILKQILKEVKKVR